MLNVSAQYVRIGKSHCWFCIVYFLSCSVYFLLFLKTPLNAIQASDDVLLLTFNCINVLFSTVISCPPKCRYLFTHSICSPFTDIVVFPVHYIYFIQIYHFSPMFSDGVCVLSSFSVYLYCLCTAPITTASSAKRKRFNLRHPFIWIPIEGLRFNFLIKTFSEAAKHLS